MNQSESKDFVRQEKYTAKWPDEHRVIHWSDRENKTWQTLIERQYETITNRACDAFMTGLEALQLPKTRVPQLTEMNHHLAKTNWTMQAVAGTVLPDEFFTLLKNRIFPVANFIRLPEELDYLSQPDIFHEIFGHGPLLMDPIYADFVQWYGDMALQLPKNKRQRFSRFFWYTIEFGLMKSEQGLRILGAGILSSHEETISCLGQDPKQIPRHVPFDLMNTLMLDYDYRVIQKQYFIMESMDQLYQLQHDPEVKDVLMSDLGQDVDIPSDKEGHC